MAAIRQVRSPAGARSSGFKTALGRSVGDAATVDTAKGLPGRIRKSRGRNPHYRPGPTSGQAGANRRGVAGPGVFSIEARIAVDRRGESGFNHRRSASVRRPAGPGGHREAASRKWKRRVGRGRHRFGTDSGWSTHPSRPTPTIDSPESLTGPLLVDRRSRVASSSTIALGLASNRRHPSIGSRKVSTPVPRGDCHAIGRVRIGSDESDHSSTRHVTHLSVEP
jgi:hypothetical protein